MLSKELLEKALNNYTGTVLYVSHDRYFINQTATRIIELTGQEIFQFIGNYDYYLDKKDTLHAASTTFVQTETNTNAPSENKLSWQQQKDQQASIRKIENEIKKIEKSIEKLEERSAEIDELLTQEEIFSNLEELQKLSKEKESIETELMEQMERWEELSQKL
jgi:ATP-binding cassette subfamily F protein 3